MRSILFQGNDVYNLQGVDNKVFGDGGAYIFLGRSPTNQSAPRTLIFCFETAHSRITLLIPSTTHSSITCVVVMDVVVASTCTSVMVLKMYPYHSLPASSFLTVHLLVVVCQ